MSRDHDTTMISTIRALEDLCSTVLQLNEDLLGGEQWHLAAVSSFMPKKPLPVFKKSRSHNLVQGASPSNLIAEQDAS
ncbi:hypothetical protein IFT66_22920 [Rhizobium sp. CFBP 13726]|uniref:hypothetical protein n=1 Tax=Rhizobium sp. CFBP 13726 TaxID=2775296 RepID=UPI00177F51E6|nr:hypothetical protein [Rhizobium sp. CFBP 13726]MBD8653945.1 hypothetical protein [Rhizobium sp. CFBP 13726]